MKLSTASRLCLSIALIVMHIPSLCQFTRTQALDFIGLDEFASKEDIDRQCRRYFARYHPDKNGASEASHERFLQINNACEQLRSPEKFDPQWGKPNNNASFTNDSFSQDEEFDHFEERFSKFNSRQNTNSHDFSNYEFESILDLDEILDSALSGELLSDFVANSLVYNFPMWCGERVIRHGDCSPWELYVSNSIAGFSNSSRFTDCKNTLIGWVNYTRLSYYRWWLALRAALVHNRETLYHLTHDDGNIHVACIDASRIGIDDVLLFLGFDFEPVSWLYGDAYFIAGLPTHHNTPVRFGPEPFIGIGHYAVGAGWDLNFNCFDGECWNFNIYYKARVLAILNRTHTFELPTDEPHSLTFTTGGRVIGSGALGFQIDYCNNTLEFGINGNVVTRNRLHHNGSIIHEEHPATILYGLYRYSDYEAEWPWSIVAGFEGGVSNERHNRHIGGWGSFSFNY